MLTNNDRRELPIRPQTTARRRGRGGDVLQPHGGGASRLSNVRRQQHPGCFACGASNCHGLGLEFSTQGDGIVEAQYRCPATCAGYPGMVHGGVICTLLDGAMTNCLFAQGVVGVTVEMNVRFRHPMATDQPATVRAWPEAGGSPIHRLAAEVTQQDHVVATATARFLEKSAMQWFGYTTP